MDADARVLARFGLLLAAACVLTGAVAFAQLGAGLGDGVTAAADATVAPASPDDGAAAGDPTAPAASTRQP